MKEQKEFEYGSFFYPYAETKTAFASIIFGPILQYFAVSGSDSLLLVLYCRFYIANKCSDNTLDTLITKFYVDVVCCKE